MDTIWYLLLFLVGLVILYFGAESTLHGAVGIARRMGIPSLLVGLTLIAYGTSAPELAIDLTAAIGGKTELAFGDLIGSNLANLGLILSIAVLIRPIQIHSQMVRFEFPLMLLQAVCLWVLCWDGRLGRLDGALLMTLFLVTAVWSIRRGLLESRRFKREVIAHVEEFESGGAWKDLIDSEKNLDGDNSIRDDLQPGMSRAESLPSPVPDPTAGAVSQEGDRSYPLQFALTLGGLFALIAGAQLMVFGAVQLARGLGVSELTIGLTIVAVGTSLPELATAILASRKNESEIVVGNVAGSNLFNIGCILGLVAMISPIEIGSRSLWLEVPILIGFTALLVPMAMLGTKLQRWLGIVYLVGFVGFLGWQALSAAIAH